jgi:hypothetical protein
MRTAQRDQGGLTTFAFSVTDAASGSGVAQGVAWSFVRSATGVYNFNIDTRLTMLSYVVTTSNVAYIAIAAGTGAAGTFQVQTYSAPGTAANGSFRVAVTVLDKR